MKKRFENNTPVTIDRFRPTDVTSTIDVANVAGKIKRVEVTIDIHHTFTRDLRISLVDPRGKTVLLVGREGVVLEVLGGVCRDQVYATLSEQLNTGFLDNDVTGKPMS